MDDIAADRCETTAADSFLSQLRTSGVDYVFANAGTDFPPIIDALAQDPEGSGRFPEVLAIPHETVAVGMAHGYFLASGKPQAVMVHVNVGLANSVMGAINAAADAAPMLLCSGRTPVTEGARTGARSSPIHWGQEMPDQAALVRQSVKWDYELKYPEQAADAVVRGLAIAQSDPPGPVYLSLPREVLSEAHPPQPAPAPVAPARAGSAPKARIAEVARALEAARSPLIVTQGVRGTAAAEALAALAETLDIPVVEHFATRFALPTDHPMNAGRAVDPWLAEADLVLVVDALVPWIPQAASPAAGARVVSIGPDPLFARAPVRGFASDTTLAGDVAAILTELRAAARPDRADAGAREARRARLTERRASRRAALAGAVERAQASPMLQPWISDCLSRALPEDALIFNELGCDAAFLNLRRPDSYFATPLSGGLGWGLPAALGAQLADRSRQVVACVGDGSYVFANPTACHHAAEMHGLPLLTIVMNNQKWNAVRRSTLQMYPDWDESARPMPLTVLSPGPDYSRMAAACGAAAERVEDWRALPEALDRALALSAGGRQTMLEIVVGV